MFCKSYRKIVKCTFLVDHEDLFIDIAVKDISGGADTLWEPLIFAVCIASIYDISLNLLYNSRTVHHIVCVL